MVLGLIPENLYFTIYSIDSWLNKFIFCKSKLQNHLPLTRSHIHPYIIRAHLFHTNCLKMSSMWDKVLGHLRGDSSSPYEFIGLHTYCSIPMLEVHTALFQCSKTIFLYFNALLSIILEANIILTKNKWKLKVPTKKKDRKSLTNVPWKDVYVPNVPS